MGEEVRCTACDASHAGLYLVPGYDQCPECFVKKQGKSAITSLVLAQVETNYLLGKMLNALNKGKK